MRSLYTAQHILSLRIGFELNPGKDVQTDEQIAGTSFICGAMIGTYHDASWPEQSG